MQILVYLLIGIFAFCLGVIFWGMFLNRFRHYAGTIVVSYDEELEKLLYSLELETDPDALQYETEVIFRIDASGKSRNRE